MGQDQTSLMNRCASVPYAVLAGLLCICGTPAWTESTMDRYQVILERKPFGDTTPSSTQDPSSTPASYAATLRLSAIYKLDAKSWAGLIDTQSNRSLTLSVGELSEGVELVSVDLLKEEAVIRKNGELGVLRLDSGPATPAGTPSPALPVPGMGQGGSPPIAPNAVRMSNPQTDPQMEQMQNRRKKMLDQLREQIELQQKARANADAGSNGTSEKVLQISTPMARGQIHVLSTSSGFGQISVQINGEAIPLSE